MSPVERNREEHEAPSAGASDLAADRAGSLGGLIGRIDELIRDLGRHAAFALPCNVEELPEPPEMAPEQRVLHLWSDLLLNSEAGGRLVLARLIAAHLIIDHASAGARPPGEAQH